MYRAHLDQLTIPVYSPFLDGHEKRQGEHERGVVMISHHQFRLLCALMRRPRWTQRQLATESGYQDPSGVSRTLALFVRLGVVAASITRGRRGSTVAWVRRGVHLLRNVAQHLRERETNHRSERDRQHLGTENPVGALVSLLGGGLPAHRTGMRGDV